MSRSYRPRLEASLPSRAPSFDPWNSSSTGHQTEKNRLSGSTAWQENRAIKLSAQFSDKDRRGGIRLLDRVGAGASAAEDAARRETKKRKNDHKLKTGNPSDIDEGILQHLVPLDENDGTVRILLEATADDNSALCEDTSTQVDEEPKKSRPGYEQGSSRLRPCLSEHIQDEPTFDYPTSAQPETASPVDARNSSYGHEKLFANLTFFINASTYPAISDHKLKQLLVSHGGSLALGLSRRRVTHVLLSSKSTGGSLAARKLQREIASTKSSVKFVTVDWVLQSIRDGRRLPERLFQAASLVPASQNKLRVSQALVRKT